MAQPGISLDTPRTNLGDNTYLTNQPEFDISQELSFQSPSKDNNLIQQFRNGRRGAAVQLKTPRSRVPLRERRNLPAFAGGGEFTPLLKSATRNSALNVGRENGVPRTPAFLKPGALDNIAEDLSPVPNIGSSVYDDTRNGSYVNGTPIPQLDSSSAASTPMALLPRRTQGTDLLQDGNPLSLREQENVIDRIEKENFGLKLKIHFLEEALRKAGPEYSEAALKENTDLKVDQVTMQRELARYHKTLTTAERDLEAYRQQVLDMQEKVKRKQTDTSQQAEIARLEHHLEDKELEIQELRDRLDEAERQGPQAQQLRDEIGDLEADVCEKDRAIDDGEDEIENLKAQSNQREDRISVLEQEIQAFQRREVDLKERAGSREELAEAEEKIEDLQRDVYRLKVDLEEARGDRQEAITEKDRAISDLEELQDEMANKSITTKGLSRQVEEKANRLQDELEDLRDTHKALNEEHVSKSRSCDSLQKQVHDLQRDAGVREQTLKDDLERTKEERLTISEQLQTVREELEHKTDEKDLLQVRHDALTSESAGLQRDLSKAQSTIEDLEDKLEHEKTLSLKSEREIRDQCKSEIDRLHDEIEELRAVMREKERLFDDKIDRWDAIRRNIEAQRQSAEERAAGLQRTLDKLQEVETTLSSKEMMLKEALSSEKKRFASEEAVLKQQIEDLNKDIDARRHAFEEARSQLSNVKEELGLSRREQKIFAEKIEGLEDEIEVLQTSLDDESEQAQNDLNAAKHESDSFRQQCHVLKLELARTQSALSSVQAELESLHESRHESSAFRDRLSTKLRENEDKLAMIREEKQDLQDQLARASLDTHTLRATLADVEAERDELKSQLKGTQEQEETFRLDQEKIDLRTARIKLDSELRRLREDSKLMSERQQALQNTLREEIERASDEESRLNSIITDLSRKLSNSSSSRELSSAKRTIQTLEHHVQELALQTASGDPQHDVSNELSIMRRDLSAARQQEMEYVQREASQKDVVRGLKRQVADLERKAHNLEISHLQSASPNSSGGSARKSELIEVRHQLATAHQTLKELRSQLKEVERDAAHKASSAALEMRAQTAAWEEEKDRLERDLDAATLSKNELLANNGALEQSLSRLRSKISHLERELQVERRNATEDRTMALERRDLHDMLRETQVRAGELERALQARDGEFEKVSAQEADMRAQLQRVRDERRSQASQALSELERLAHELRSKERAWDEERRRLSRGVRFPNVSLSELKDDRRGEIGGATLEARDKVHVKELRGLAMQIEWLKARFRREEGLRADAAFAKRFMGMQIELFSACNKADLSLLRQMGIKPDPALYRTDRRVADGTAKPTLRTLAIMVRASVRMRRGAERWAAQRKVHERLLQGFEAMRRRGGRDGKEGGRDKEKDKERGRTRKSLDAQRR
ncbi:MAG: hypothetical protein M1818_007862 [Claussenomyces sp. TS43310]|nr:MAG: hypothetical protein M1818_007862 [Claussenomyces sp. TS43310]